MQGDNAAYLLSGSGARFCLVKARFLCSAISAARQPLRVEACGPGEGWCPSFCCCSGVCVCERLLPGKRRCCRRRCVRFVGALGCGLDRSSFPSLTCCFMSRLAQELLPLDSSTKGSCLCISACVREVRLCKDYFGFCKIKLSKTSRKE